jgi:hypothetical protein
MSNTNNQPIIFLDSIGRTVVGVVKTETEDVLSVQNPALVAVNANPQTNQLQLQILPLFFKEFLSDQSKETVWHYKKSNITLSELPEYNPQFVAQYFQLFGGAQQTPASEPKVVKLFDEEESK